MGKEILTFGDIETEKNNFYRNKIRILLKDVDIEKVLVSTKISFGKKTISTLLLSAYVKNYDGQTKWMYFSIEDDGLLEKYNTIWNKVSADIKTKNLKASLSTTKNFKNKSKIS